MGVVVLRRVAAPAGLVTWLGVCGLCWSACGDDGDTDTDTATGDTTSGDTGGETAGTTGSTGETAGTTGEEPTDATTSDTGTTDAGTEFDTSGPPDVAGDDGASPVDYMDPFAPGKFRAAATAFTFVDAAGDAPALKGTVWYPTDATEGRPIKYFENAIDGNALNRAPIADDGPYPLIVFSHGHLAFDAQSYSMMEYLATHGYIVAAPTHIGDTLGLSYKPENFIQMVIDRPRAVTQVIDRLLAENESPGSRFAGKVDTDRVAMAGHSLGGLTTIAVMGPAISLSKSIETCQSFNGQFPPGQWFICGDMLKSFEVNGPADCDPCVVGDARVKTFVAMSPGFPEALAPGEMAKLKQPLLLMGGRADRTTIFEESVAPFFDASTVSGNTLWGIADSGHYAFSDGCELFGGGANDQLGCGPDYMDPAEQHALIYPAVVGWFGWHLRARDDRYMVPFTNDYVASKAALTIQRKP